MSKKFKIKTRSYSTLGDTLTPVNIYLSLKEKYTNTFLLESSDYHGDDHSYSYICFMPYAGIELMGNQFTTQLPGLEPKVSTATNDNIVELVNDFISSFETDDSIDTKCINNGCFGFIKYDAVQYFEDIKFSSRPEDILMKYQCFEFVIAFNHHNNELKIFKHSIDELNSNSLDLKGVWNIIKSTPNLNFTFKKVGNKVSNIDGPTFVENVKKGIEHCYRGDVFQIVLSRQFKQNYEGNDFQVYRALRSVNPSPYLFYFDYGDYTIFGSSPEAQLIINNGQVTIHPIAGTFKRSGDDEKDRQLAKALSDDPKENAEHIMLVDLARNDLSRNSKEVTVEVYREVQFYSHVIHLVSKVTGKLTDVSGKFRLVGDTFPAGTLSGAPKYRAMELIDEIENTPRGIYGGCIGHLSFNGDFNHAIMIRTFMSQDNILTFQAGAGVVADSVPEKELQEVENKLGALNKAILLAENI